MPGEQLMCIWHAVYAQGSYVGSGPLPKDSLLEVIYSFDKLQSVYSSINSFNENFKNCTSVSFKDFKAFADKYMTAEGYPFHATCDEIERKCWELCFPYYKTTLNKEEVRQLWMISNRLTEEDSFPPVIFEVEGNWFMDNMLSTMERVCKGKDVFITKSSTFQDLLNVIERTILHEVTHEKIQKSIDSLYTSMVTNVLKSGWMYKRTRKQANWTNWLRRWCFLTPHKIIYTTDETCSPKGQNIKGEILITKHTKVLGLEDYSGFIHKLKGRFLVSNEPVIDMEISVGSTGERTTWLSALKEAITCCKEKTTPLQKFLNERRNRIKSGDAVTTQTMIKESPAAKRTANIQIPTEKKVDAPKNMPIQNMKDSLSTPENLIATNEEKMKTIFMKMDQDGNGLIDKTEFASFLHSIGLQMSDKEVNLIFRSIDSDNSGFVSFEEFKIYFSKHVMNETSSAECVNAMRTAFLEADRDGSGTLSFKEFVEYIWERKRSARISKVMNCFNTTSESNPDEISFTDFQQIMNKDGHSLMLSIVQESFDEDEKSDVFREELKHVYDDTEAKELTSYIRKRWKAFATFRRIGETGSVVMKGEHGMVADIVPGEYSMVDLACFSDLPPLVPKHTVIKGVKWISSSVTGKSGKVVFPKDFDGKIIRDVATNELIRYYGCSFADSQQEKVSLLYRHGIQDFTYENGYLEKYVTATNGGAGIEKHDFSHLDCPLVADSGTFILAKFTDDDELHITGFKIPVRHTLYIPGGTIHCNDYLKGTWRTMLSDETDIDHVHLTRILSNENGGKYEHFRFEFFE